MIRVCALVALVCVLPVLAGCVQHNYGFSSGEFPAYLDGVQLRNDCERIRSGKTRPPLYNDRWLPLIALRKERFTKTREGDLPAGYRYSRLRSFGPLGVPMVAYDEAWFDTEGQRYEAAALRSYVLGIFLRETREVRVATGTRYETRNSFLYFLRFAPSIRYEPNRGILPPQVAPQE